MNNFKRSFSNFWGKVKNRMYNFMAGRYGVDNLYKGLMWVILACILLYMFTGLTIFSYLEIALIIWATFRAFSKNYEARRRENNKYLQITNSIKKKFRLTKKRFTDRKTYRYRTCPNCKQTLRIPASKGQHTVRCPKCGNEFETKVR